MIGRRRRSRDVDADPGDIYVDLRRLALTSPIYPPRREAPQVCAVIIDIPSDDEFATVVATADGAASMYTSTGGGLIGAGDHDSVAWAIHNLLVETQAILDQMPPSDDVDLPPADLVNVTVRTPDGPRHAAVPAAAFWGEEPSGVAAFIDAAQGLLTELRRHSRG